MILIARNLLAKSRHLKYEVGFEYDLTQVWMIPGDPRKERQFHTALQLETSVSTKDHKTQ